MRQFLMFSWLNFTFEINPCYYFLVYQLLIHLDRHDQHGRELQPAPDLSGEDERMKMKTCSFSGLTDDLFETIRIYLQASIKKHMFQEIYMFYGAITKVNKQWFQHYISL